MNENKPVIGLHLHHPYQPLFTDKLIMWLGSHLAGQGIEVKPISQTEGANCDLVISNAKCDFGSAPCIVVKDVLDLVSRLRLGAAALIGRTKYYHARTQEKRASFMQNMVNGARKIPFMHKIKTAYQPVKNGAHFRGKVVFRINIDYDQEGLRVLDEILQEYDIALTLAVAGNEIAGREDKLIRLLKQSQKIDLASHSYSHCVYLPNLSKEEQFVEIKHNHDYLKRYFGQEVKGFVSPYTLYNQDTFEVLHSLGYEWFIRSYLFSPLVLPGYDLVDLGTNIFKRHLRSWRESCLGLLVDTTLVLQLHLRDLLPLEQEIKSFLEFIVKNEIELINCNQYFQSYTEKEKKREAAALGT